jgi:hypothetical protein
MPHSAGLGAILDQAVARIRFGHALRSAAAGALAAAVVLVGARALPAGSTTASTMTVAAFIVTAAAVFVWLGRARTRASAARALERADPSLRNLVITAEELTRHDEGTPPYMRTRVLADAGRRAAAADISVVARLSHDGLALLVSIVLLVTAASVRVHVEQPGSGRTASPSTAGSVPSDAWLVDIVPPSYTGRPTVHLKNPASLEALAGSLATLRIPDVPAAEVRLNGALLATKGGVAQAALIESGYVAVDAGSIHHLLPLTVTPDRVPDVRITAPAKDLRVPSTSTTIPIDAEAVDDLALQSFEIRYTVVSGTGEQFTFTEGALPVTLTRGSEQAWRASGKLALAQLKLEPGDSLIYHAVAADRRPGDAGTASSDTYFIEVAGPGDVPLEGVEMPPDKERYILSEAMIVLKIQRLMARERSMPRGDVESAVATIAGEQRAVRANFIFLLGGEVEDEDVEAETSNEIQEGRLANQARKEIVTATVLMGKVERALAAISTKDALPPAQDAVKALQRAFGHSRYLLRALPSRVRLDPARRLTGDLTSASDWTRVLAPTASDPSADAARAALLDLTLVAREIDDASRRVDAGQRLTRLAERLLSLPRGTGEDRQADLQAAVRDVLAARDAVSAGQIDAAHAALQRAAGPIVARAQTGRIDSASIARDAARLAGAAAGPGGSRP